MTAEPARVEPMKRCRMKPRRSMGVSGVLIVLHRLAAAACVCLDLGQDGRNLHKRALWGLLLLRPRESGSATATPIQYMRSSEPPTRLAHFQSCRAGECYPSGSLGRRFPASIM